MTSLYINGFKSIDNAIGQLIPFDMINILIGANTAGKTNVLLCLNLLKAIATGLMDHFTARNMTDRLLHFGHKVTKEMRIIACFDDEKAKQIYEYDVSLTYVNREIFNITNELITCKKYDETVVDQYSLRTRRYLKSGLLKNKKLPTVMIQKFLSNFHLYHIDDTSDSSAIRSRSLIENVHPIQSNASNLASFLKFLKDCEPYQVYYDRLLSIIRQILPDFGDFILKPSQYDAKYTTLSWFERKHPEHEFVSDDIPNGALRFIALATILLQPPNFMPSFLAIDELEMGLHPLALLYITDLIHRATEFSQVIITTQSPRLLDEFSPDQIFTVERGRDAQTTAITKPDEEKLSIWLEDYSLSELWEKNIIRAEP
jgi:predicted ATPase